MPSVPLCPRVHAGRHQRAFDGQGSFAHAQRVVAQDPQALDVRQQPGLLPAGGREDGIQALCSTAWVNMLSLCCSFQSEFRVYFALAPAIVTRLSTAADGANAADAAGLLTAAAQCLWERRDPRTTPAQSYLIFLSMCPKTMGVARTWNERFGVAVSDLGALL
eukprot:CAMPEP_0203840190 /NCGR_PEP_ID=MMETSP0359-20131031/624_1 /ASSEMBLY_ACC=CAM_ASM_000338 /TAXON_ID=268821 /ORGANISM="Scrippsiella Hangoei, Strain SHTV-5" /LENGTH=162 /DNA_ID=CAMNT_0050754351 /DNA_START=295 /DNA_END=781 /DNA_ORIENTATION=-